MKRPASENTRIIRLKFACWLKDETNDEAPVDREADSFINHQNQHVGFLSEHHPLYPTDPLPHQTEAHIYKFPSHLQSVFFLLRFAVRTSRKI